MLVRRVPWPVGKRLTEPTAIYDALISQPLSMEHTKPGQVRSLRRMEVMRLAEVTIRTKAINNWKRSARTRKGPRFHEEVEHMLADIEETHQMKAEIRSIMTELGHPPKEG